MYYFKYLRFNLNKLSNYHLFLIYICFLIATFIPLSIYSNIYLEKFPDIIDKDNNLILNSLQYDYANLLTNLYENGQYVQKIGTFEVNFHLARMPFYPFFFLLLSKISLNFYFIFFVKNLFLFSVIFFSVLNFLKRNDKLIYHLIIFLFAFIYVPYNFHILACINFEDTFVSVFFPILIFYLNKNSKSLIIFSILIFSLYLLKSSLWIFCISFTIIYFFFNFFMNKFSRNIYFFSPLFLLLIAIIGWGIFGLKKAGYFPIGSTISSTSTYFATSMFNKKFHKNYPQISVDELLNDKYNDLEFESEKNFYDYFKKENLKFLSQNYDLYLIGILKKINFIFFGINKDGNFDQNIIQVRYSNFPNKIIMNFALLIALVSFFKMIRKRKLSQIDFLFLAMFFLYIAPHIVAWATSKHLVPIFILSKIYLLIKCFKLKIID